MWKNNLQLKNSETYLSTDNRSCNFPTKFCGKYSSSLAYAHFVISQKMHSLFFSLIVRHKRFCFGFPFILISSILVFSQIIYYVSFLTIFLFWKFFRRMSEECQIHNVRNRMTSYLELPVTWLVVFRRLSDKFFLPILRDNWNISIMAHMAFSDSLSLSGTITQWIIGIIEIKIVP